MRLILSTLLLTLYAWSPMTAQGGKQGANPTPPAWLADANIYEVNIRQYTPEGTFRAFARHLPRLQKMGVKVLWLMPIHPIGELNRKGSMGSYYAVRDYKGINPDYGTLADFKALVKDVHQRDMKIIIDWVANHSAPDHAWVKEHPDWYRQDAQGKPLPPEGTDWIDVAAFNYEKPALHAAMTDAMVYWLKEADIDGFRCDVAEMVPLEFWKKNRKALDAVKKVFMLAEGEKAELHPTFDATYSWSAHHFMNHYHKDLKKPAQLDSLIRQDLKKYPPTAFRMQFTSNHDENSWNGTEYERLGPAAGAFAVLAATMPGIPLLYSGQESALDKRLRFFDKDTIDWKNYPLQDFYTQLLKLRQAHPALQAGITAGTYKAMPVNNSVFAFKRTKGSDEVYILINLSDQPSSATITDKNAPKRVALKSRESTKLPTQNVQSYALPAWGYVVLVD